MVKFSEEKQNLNPEQKEPEVSDDVLKERATDIDVLYEQRIAEFKAVVERFFPHEENKPGEFDKVLSEAKQKMTEGKGDAQTKALSEAERLALALEENRNWAEQQRAQELRDLQEIKSHSTKK